MKYLNVICTCLIVAVPIARGFAQSSNENYVRVADYTHGKPGSSYSISGLSSLEQPALDSSVTVKYYDGLARQKQWQLLHKNADSIVISQDYYDSLGRLHASTKPFVSARSGSMNYINPNNFAATNLDVINGITDHNKPLFKAFGDEYPFERRVFLSDPLGRIGAEMAFGEIYHNGNHHSKLKYLTDGIGLTNEVLTEDEDGRQILSETDVAGNKVKAVVRLSTVDSLVTATRYDVLGLVTHSVTPMGYAGLSYSGHTQAEHIIEDASVQTLSYTKPWYADRAWITLRWYYATGGGGQGLPCNTVLTIRYRTYTNGQPDEWIYPAGTIMNVVLKANQSRIEWQKTFYSLDENDPEGCTPPTGLLYMSLYDSALTAASGWESKHVTRNIYDTRGRLTEATAPDKGTTKHVYDAQGQIRFTQDENHRLGFGFAGTTRYWTYFKYDSLGRVIEQGEFNLNPTQAELRTSVMSGTLIGPGSYPTASHLPTVINTYDYYGTGLISLGTTDTAQSKSRTRLTRSRILDPNTGTWMEEAYVYDEYGRVTVKHMYVPELQSTKRIRHYYDASGRTVKTAYQPQVPSESFFQWFKYGRLSRLDSVWSSRSDSLLTAKLEAVYTYDDNHGGKVQQMRLGNNIQTVDYTYSIRDWLKSVNSNQFSETMKYHDATVNPRYNGNIAQMSWNTAGNSGAYDFTYDGANRLTDAVTTSGPDFSEKLIQYDANGNIQSLTRSTSAAINYHYANASKPNQLTSVTDGLSATYSYDGNGNMTNDNTKGEFTYDYRNMPIKVVTNDTVIEYAYDAAGQRIRKTLKNNGTTLSETIYVRGLGGNVLAEYATGSIDHFNIYGNGLIGKLEPAIRTITIQNQTINGQTITAKDSVIILPESNVEGESTVQADQAQLAEDKRYYYLTDHLGSTRVVLDQSGNVDSWSDYYPFGKISRSSQTLNSPKEKFTGKMFDDEVGLTNIGPRYLNHDIARWTTTDPMGDMYPSLNGYNYAANNPIALKDPSGNFIVSVHYEITWTALSQMGYGDKQSDLIAHYASVYADHPSEFWLSANNMFSDFKMSYRNYDYSATANSQDKESSLYNSWHAMRGAHEDISANEAKERGQAFGWNKIFESASYGPLDKLQSDSKGIQALGQGLHALQDATVHKGAANTFSSHAASRDVYGSTAGAELVTKSALVIHQLLNGDFSGLQDGMTLDISGMSKSQQTQILDLLHENGFATKED